MVAEFQDDLDLDDVEAAPLPPPSVSIPSKDLPLSSDEDELQPKVTVAQDEDLESEPQNPM